MNLNDLISKLRIIESNEVAPVHTDGPAEEEGIEIIGGPMGGMMGGMGHSEPPKQQDSVSMNVSLNGAGAQGVRDLMNILHNIEQGVDHTDHSDEHDHNEPIMGDMVDAMADEQMQFQPEQGLEEVQDDDGQTWGNSAYGDSGHHTHDIDSITMHGDDMNSKGSREPHKRQGGGNPYPMNETLVAKLQAHYDSIKEDAGGPINPNAKCNICHTPYAKHFRFDPPGDPTGKRTSTLIRGLCGAVPQNFPDLYSMSESDKKTMSRAAKGVAEGHSDDDEEKKIRHLMRKYGWSHQEALEYYHYEQHDPKDYEDMEESAMWRDPKYKGKLFTQKKGDSDDYDSIDYGYGMKERPKKDPGQKRRTDAVGDEWENTDKLKSYNGDTGNTTGGAHWNGTGGSTDMKDWKPSPYKDRGVNTQGPRKGLVSKSGIRDVKNRIKGALGHHHTPNLPEQMNESAEVNAMLALNKRLNG